MLTVNNRHFFAPLTSPKSKHFKIKNSDPTTFKVQDKNRFYGAVLLNNMIPVKAECINKIDINNLDDITYKNLLNREYRIIGKNADKIVSKANVLYRAVTNQSNAYFCKLSCDFGKLEEACDLYSGTTQ